MHRGGAKAGVASVRAGLGALAGVSLADTYAGVRASSNGHTPSIKPLNRRGLRAPRRGSRRQRRQGRRSAKHGQPSHQHAARDVEPGKVQPRLHPAGRSIVKVLGRGVFARIACVTHQFTHQPARGVVDAQLDQRRVRQRESQRRPGTRRVRNRRRECRFARTGPRLDPQRAHWYDHAGRRFIAVDVDRGELVDIERADDIDVARVR